MITWIKTHDSESRGKEEAGRTQRMSELFTGSTAVKFVNALNKPPLNLSLSYQGLSMFYLYRISNPTMYQNCYKGSQVTKPIVKICYKLLYVIQGVKVFLI